MKNLSDYQRDVRNIRFAYNYILHDFKKENEEYKKEGIAEILDGLWNVLLGAKSKVDEELKKLNESK